MWPSRGPRLTPSSACDWLMPLAAVQWRFSDIVGEHVWFGRRADYMCSVEKEKTLRTRGTLTATPLPEIDSGEKGGRGGGADWGFAGPGRTSSSASDHRDVELCTALTAD